MSNIKINPKVQQALLNGEAVVALESTIISHGMPYPQNYNTALECERIIINNGAIPATIAIINGVIHVGLNCNEIEYIAKNGPNVIKTSKRDLPYIIATKNNGATTVSATMYIASLVGINVFATGGIGGVHRGVSETWDISADLEEFTSSNVCVICAGAKAILDLEKTMEYLETKGVLVLGYQTNYLPAFYHNKSPYLVPYRINEAFEIAKIIKTKNELKISKGLLVVNPIPDEYSLDEEIMNKAINEALEQMHKKMIKGKDTTPYLLQKVKELTNEKSLDANIQLVYNNCRLAAQVAKELIKLNEKN